MTPPRRWLDDAATSDAEREVLRAGLSIDPPAGAEGAVWASLLAKLPPGGLPPGPGSGGSGATSGVKAAAGKAAAAKATTAAVSGGLLKSALIGAGSAVVVLAGYAAVAPRAPEPLPAVALEAPQEPRAVAPPQRSAPPAAVAPSAEPSGEPSAAPSGERRPAAEARPLAAPTPTASAAPSAEPAVERETLLREESRLVSEARDALRTGNPAGALAKLEQLRTRFPGGVLTQEREALAIEALARSGQRAEAAARAAAFVKAYPSSPLAGRVQTFAN